MPILPAYPQLDSDLRLQCLILVLQNFLVVVVLLVLLVVGVPIIEQPIGGHISTVTGQNSAKLLRLEG